jgi:hypothetical protein
MRRTIRRPLTRPMLPPTAQTLRVELRRDYKTDLRVAIFVRFVVHMDAQYNFRILGSRLCPLALNNLPLFDARKRSLHL